MTQAPPGWYPDPQAPPGVVPLPRWWDGNQWTEHYGPAAPVAHAPYVEPPATTPDGQPLAGWWSRVWAVLIDGLILLPVFVLITVPFWGDIGDAFSSYWDDVRDSVDNGSSSPSAWQLQRDLLGPLIAIALLGGLVNFVYNVGFVLWKQATPGKLLLGLRIRLRETPGRMPFTTVLVRWATQYGPTYVIGSIPFVGYVASLYATADALWPLGNRNKQAIHDLAAKTNVVRTR